MDLDATTNFFSLAPMRKTIMNIGLGIKMVLVLLDAMIWIFVIGLLVMFISKK
jgi:hypothetical protein